MKMTVTLKVTVIFLIHAKIIIHAWNLLAPPFWLVYTYRHATP